MPLAPDGRSLLRHAFLRARAAGGEILVVSAEAQRDQILSELPELEPSRLLLEPEPRGTGPALAWAALEALNLRPGAVMVSLHADHYMPDESATRRALVSAALWAKRSGRLIAVGLPPSWPAPGFGYIERGAPLEAPPELLSVLPLWTALGFVEKPGSEQAREMLATDRFLWNTGLFAWRADLLLSEMARFAPATEQAVRAALAEGGAGRDAFVPAWSRVPPGVVERLVLERSEQLGVLPVDLRWSDLGSFLDLHRIAVQGGLGDSAGNVASGEVLLLGTEGSMVRAESGRKVVLVQGEAMLVVDTPDALLICPLAQAQRVSEVVERLRQEGRGDLL